MKIAIVHDWFNNKVGGAERVAFALADAFPRAPVYSLIYNPAKFSNRLDPSRVRTSYLQHLPARIKQHPRYLLPLIPSAIRGLDFSEFDIVISSSSAFVKNISHPLVTKHICYCHSPMRFAYDYRAAYMSEQRVDPLRRLGGSLLREYIKRWDQKHTSSVNVWVANSQNVAARIQKYYQQSSQIIYPPIDTASFKSYHKLPKQNFYLTAAALTPYKKLDLAIIAANQLRLPLKILGEGLDKPRLQKLAGPTIEFCGFVSEKEKLRIFSQAKGLIYPNEEDFGMVMVEALAASTPVIAFNKGGAKEIVLPGKTGVLFSQQTVESLMAAITESSAHHYQFADLTAQAKKFDQAIFDQKIKALVKQVGA